MADTISILPASLLCHILSFLPTKEAVATSVLSKKWNPLWRSVPTLDFYFYDRLYENEPWKDRYSSFVQWVYEVILSRDLFQPIQTLRLCCIYSHCDPIKVKILVNAAIQRRVEHLDLTLLCGFSAYHVDLNMNLPSAIFRHRTLVVLKLKGIALKDVSSVDLPSLKILHLDKVRSLEIIYLSNLLSGCPVLEDLEAKDLYFDNSYQRSSTHREFKRLPKLIRADISNHYILLVILSNVEFLSIDRGYDVDDAMDDEEMDTENGDDPNPYAKDLIPVFRNLVHIELTFFYNTMNWPDVIEVIKHCPKLQILVIDQNFSYVDDYDNIDWRYPRSGVPKCFHYILKHASLKITEAQKVKFDLQDILCEMQEFYKP